MSDTLEKNSLQVIMASIRETKDYLRYVNTVLQTREHQLNAQQSQLITDQTALLVAQTALEVERFYIEQQKMELKQREEGIHWREMAFAQRVAGLVTDLEKKNEELEMSTSKKSQN